MMIKHIVKLLILFCIGGFTYNIIELLFRGYTHWTMFIVGGICFYSIGLVNEYFTFEMSLVFQMFIGSLIITSIEFVSGYIVNIKLEMNIWDYSNLPFNIMGQICIPFSFFWFLLSAVAIVLDDYLRYFLFQEEKPRYKFL